MESLKSLLEVLGIETPPGATDQQIRAFGAQTELRLPGDVRSLYQTCNGVVVREHALAILSLDEVLKYVEAFGTLGSAQVWGYFPFTNSNDSNPFCVCCGGPLSGYLVQVFHDDEAAVKFRSLDRFFGALQKLAENEDSWIIDDLVPDFDAAQRTKGDVQAGHDLLRQAEQLTNGERGDAYRFGMVLLSEQQVDEIAPLLQDDDPYVREAARNRLAIMDVPQAVQAVRASEEGMTRFAGRCAEVLTQAGIPTSVMNGLNLPVFYAMRNDADFPDFLRERARALLEQKAQANRSTSHSNRCPRCGALARTARAKQCPTCFFAWH